MIEESHKPMSKRDQARLRKEIRRGQKIDASEFAKKRGGDADKWRKDLRRIVGPYVRHRAVLGIDILGYSKARNLAQMATPACMRAILAAAAVELSHYESLFFDAPSDIFKDWIDTGDGGYVFCATPLQGLLLALYIQSSLQTYNSERFDTWPPMHDGADYGNEVCAIRRLTGPLTVRFAMAFDQVYEYPAWPGQFPTLSQSNLYGTGIITAARIMSRDKLDRFLIDANAFGWFQKHTNGVESLRFLPQHVALQQARKEAPPDPDSGWRSYAFQIRSKTAPTAQSKERLGYSKGIDELHSMRIGKVQAKEQRIEVYNIHVQMSHRYFLDGDSDAPDHFIVTLGNLNPQGIGEDKE